MKILHLTLKKQWFDMIAIGEKSEEYREVAEQINALAAPLFPVAWAALLNQQS